MRGFTRSLSLFSLSAAALLLGACEPTLTEPGASAGKLDLSRYVAIGDVHTAGWTNGGLARAGQEVAYPALLAQQFARAGGGAFTTPLLEAGVTSGQLTLTAVTAQNLPLLTAGASAGFSTAASGPTGCDSLARYQFPRAATVLPNNLGVPGLSLSQFSTPGLGNAANLGTSTATYNPFLERLLPANDGRSYRRIVRDARPTFFTAFVGLADVLPFITSGGTCGATLPTTPVLIRELGLLLDSALLTGGARGMIATLPELNALPLTQMRGSAVRARLGLPDSAVLYVQNATGVSVELQPNDIILAPVLGRIGRLETATGQATSAAFGRSARNPLRDRDVLSDVEARRVGSVIRAFNEEVARRTRLAVDQLGLFDVNALFSSLSRTSARIDGTFYSGDPITGGLFSVDGYSLTPRGNAVLTNNLLQAINTQFEAQIPGLDIGLYPTTRLP